MPIPLKEGTNILVEQRSFPYQYAMPSLEMATDHYNLNYVISGDRKIITPMGTYCYHAGNVTVGAPFYYARTVPMSDEPYERILIKFSPEFIVPFRQEAGQQFFDDFFLGKRIFCFSDESGDKIKAMFEEMVEEFQKDGPHTEFILQGMLGRLLFTIWEGRLPDKSEEQHKSPLTEPIMDVIVYIEKEYMKNPSLEAAAKVANFSTSYFSRLFQAQLGMSYSEYLDRVKLRHVQILLVQTKKTLMDIAQETGYCHGNYLSEQFKKKIGMTPGKYRKKAQLEKKAPDDRLHHLAEEVRTEKGAKDRR